ncbi:MAG: PDZ domain-containing protein [Planctomycetaceae bacterium]|nr:PDZ domain-containing protein [Planctomycetaceae bacterium]
MLLLVVAPGGADLAAAESQLHLVLACDDAHPELGEGFEVNEWAVRSTMVREVASSRLKLLNPDHFREEGAPPLTRKLLLNYLAALPVQPDDALIVYLACERTRTADGQERFRFSGDTAGPNSDVGDESFSREQVLAVLQKKNARLVGLITDGGSEYTQLKTQALAISTVMPPLMETSALCENLFFKSRGLLNVASAGPDQQARYYDNYNALGELPEEERRQKLVAAQIDGENVGRDHDLRYGFIRFAGEPLRGGYFTESLVEVLQKNKSQTLSWEQLLIATDTELQARLRGMEDESQHMHLLALPGTSTAPAHDPGNLLDVDVQPSGDGVKITVVHPDGLAARYGLKVGEILLTVNGRKVTSSEEVAAAAKVSTPLMRVAGMDLAGKPFSFLLDLKKRPLKASDEIPLPQMNQPPNSPPDTSSGPPRREQKFEQPGQQNNEPLRDPVEVGQEAARRIRRQISLIRGELGQEPQDRPLQVAVFPFVNSKGQITTATRDVATALAGELTRELSRSTSPAMRVLPPGELAKLPPQLLTGKESPDDSEGQAILNALNCDYLVTSRFDAVSATELLNARQPVVDIHLALHAPKLPVYRTAFQAETRSIQTSEGDPIGPFPLEVISNGNRIDLQPEQSQDLGTVYVAEIPESMLRQPFTVKLKSLGETVGYRNRDPELDKSRLFGVALFVNGVCSIGQSFGDGRFELGWGHWSQTPRHPLAAPGYVVTETDSGPKVEAQQQQREDSSVLQIDSYRVPLNSVPLVFTLPPGGEGLITVHLFAEKLPGDRRIPRGDEAIIPTQFKPVRLVPWFETPLLHAPPVLTHRIVFRVK